MTAMIEQRRNYLLTASLLVALLGQAARGQEAAERLAPETDPAVRAAVELPRTEPRHYLQAVLALIDLGRPELAAPILQELQALNLNDQQRAELVGEFGSHRMLRLARSAALAPAGQQFADACMAAADAQARDPKRIEQLLQQLHDPSPSARQAAQADLAAAGQVGAVAVLEALARERDPQRRDALMNAVVRLNGTAVGPLLGMLSTDNSELKMDVIRLVEALQVAQAAPLVAAATGATDAEQVLAKALARYEGGTRAYLADEDDHVVVWQWDDASQKLTSKQYLADEARTIWMARLALHLARLRPDIESYQRQALVLGLEAAALKSDGPAPAAEELGAAADTPLLSQALADAMKQHLDHASAKLTELIGERGDANVVHANAPQPAPLVEALDDPNRRVRFAALAAIMKLDPQTPYPGSSYLPETIGYFATAAGERRAVVAMPGANRATTVAGLLAGLGIEADAANRGAPAVRLAQSTSDLEFVLVDVDIERPGVRDVLYALRTDPATGQTPIALLATGLRLDFARRVAGEHERMLAFPRPQNEAGVTRIVDAVMGLSGRHPTTTEERVAMGEQSLEWLGQLLASDQTFYELAPQSSIVEAALYQPKLSERSAALLARMGLPESQRALLNFASQSGLPIEARAAAAKAFRDSVKQFGILLTEDEIVGQYNRYNAAATADADTQSVLSGLLDSIESRRQVDAPAD